MKTEKIFIGIFFIGLIFRFMHWPGTGPIFIILAGTLSIMYFPLGFYFFSDRKIKNQNLPLSIISGMALSVIPLGVLFKFMYWPGAAPLLIVSCISSSGVVFAVYLSKKKVNENLVTYYKNMLNRSIVLCLLSFTFFFIPV